MNIRDLRYLVALAELGNFRRAADRCFVSQPTLSGQIKKLEETLGMTLVERSHKFVKLTEGGQQILECAHRVLHEVDHMKAIASSIGNPFAGNFRLGGFPTIAPYLFPELVPFIRQAMPKLKLILMEAKTQDLLVSLQDGSIDAAILALPVDASGLVCQPLFDDEFLLAVEPDHALAQQSSVSMAELASERLLLLEEGHCLRTQALDLCQHHNIQEESFRATSLETLRQMVKAGTGVTLIPRIAADADHDICYVPFTAPAPSRVIGLVWQKGHHREAVMQQLAQIIRALPTMPPEAHYLPMCQISSSAR